MKYTSGVISLTKDKATNFCAKKYFYLVKYFHFHQFDVVHHGLLGKAACDASFAPL
jgi:hypothetical protein